MVYKPLQRTEVFPYHITSRANNRDWFTLEGEQIWSIFSDSLAICAAAYGARIHAFVLMSNHIHLLVSTPDKNLDQIMQYLIRESSRRMNFRSGRIDHAFGKRYRWSVINNPLYYSHAYKYIYQNPIRAGICTKVEDYPFSTIGTKVGMGAIGFPLSAPALSVMQAYIPDCFDALLEWLNMPPKSQGDVDLVQKALRRREFQLPNRIVQFRESRLVAEPF